VASALFWVELLFEKVDFFSTDSISNAILVYIVFLSIRIRTPSWSKVLLR